MRKQQVNFVNMKQIRKTFDNTNAFQLREDRPMLWLQRVCFFVLRKIKAFYIGDIITIERHTIDAKTFMLRLLKQKASLVDSFNMHPTTLLIGAEDYAEMMNELVATQPFSFYAEYYTDKPVEGINIRVIPWMRGCLVMPD